MSFNNGLERKKFENTWKKLRMEYAAAGMSKADIEEMYQFVLLQSAYICLKRRIPL